MKKPSGLQSEGKEMQTLSRKPSSLPVLSESSHSERSEWNVKQWLGMFQELVLPLRLRLCGGTGSLNSEVEALYIKSSRVIWPFKSEAAASIGHRRLPNKCYLLREVNEEVVVLLLFIIMKFLYQIINAVDGIYYKVWSVDSVTQRSGFSALLPCSSWCLIALSSCHLAVCLYQR